MDRLCRRVPLTANSPHASGRAGAPAPLRYNGGAGHRPDVYFDTAAASARSAESQRCEEVDEEELKRAGRGDLRRRAVRVCFCRFHAQGRRSLFPPLLLLEAPSVKFLRRHSPHC